MKLRPRAPSLLPKTCPEVPRAALCLIVSGFLPTVTGVTLTWGVPGLLLFLGIAATSLGYRINTITKL